MKTSILHNQQSRNPIFPIFQQHHLNHPDVHSKPKLTKTKPSIDSSHLQHTMMTHHIEDHCQVQLITIKNQILRIQRLADYSKNYSVILNDLQQHQNPLQPRKQNHGLVLICQTMTTVCIPNQNFRRKSHKFFV